MNMNMKHLLLVILLTKISFAGLPTCKKTDYSYYILALTWVNQYCYDNYCNQNSQPYSGDGLKQLTIHGFWPSSTDLASISCMIQYKKDPYCFTDYSFNKSSFSKKDLDDLNLYWPNFQNNDFWSYEWSKHGTCYLNIMTVQKGSKLSKNQLMKNYFLGTVEKAKALNIRLSPGVVNSKKDLANKINLHPTQFYPICQNGNQFAQLRICYDMSSQPKGQKVTTCPKSTDRNICEFPITIY